MHVAGVLDRVTRVAVGPVARAGGLRRGGPRPGEPRRPRRRMAVAVAVVVAVLLAQMAVAMVTAAVEQTPTIDEPVYVGTAADYLH